MATRTQSTLVGVGLAKEAAYNTPSASFLRVTKTNEDIISPASNIESDRDWVGKGDEFSREIFKTNVDLAGRIQKFGSAEWLTYVLAYGLGSPVETSGTYVITPLNPANTLQLPSFSVVQQVPEGGGMAIDQLYHGCIVDSFGITFQYGPGLKSVGCECNFRASGEVTSPSAVVLPSVLQEHHALAAGMSLSVNGVDIVAAATGLSGSVTWNNALLADQGYYVGSGLDDEGFAIRNRLEFGKRSVGFEFTARLLSTSTEYAMLRALTTGTATMTFAYDSTHTVTLAFTKIAFNKVENTSADGLVVVKVTCEVFGDDALGVLTATTKCGVTGIAQ